MFLAIKTLDFALLLVLLIFKFYLPVEFKELFSIKLFTKGEIFIYFIFTQYMLTFIYLIKKDIGIKKVIFLRILFVIFLSFFLFGIFWKLNYISNYSILLWIIPYFFNLFIMYIGKKYLKKSIVKKDIYFNTLLIFLYLGVVLFFLLSMAR